jgi:hemolysin activation/secretion protein
MPKQNDLHARSTGRTGNGGLTTLNIPMTTLTRSIILALGIGLYSGSASTQPLGPGSPGDTPAGGVTRPGDFRPELPAAEPAEAPIDVPTEAVPEVEKVPYGPKVYVSEIRLTGFTVFTAEELKKITAPYENRVVSSSELEDLRVALTRYYIDNGYINSGAVLPDQQVVDGVINMVIVEGKLTDYEVVGNEHLSSNFLVKRLKLGAGPPLNVNELQEQIQIILESPVIETINSALRPGDRPGEASLTTEVKEGPRFQFIPVVDNRLSPTLGEVRGVLPVYFYDLTSYGDVLSASVGFSEGLKEGYANWAIPLNAHDTTLSLFADYSNADIVEGSFSVLDIENQTSTLGFMVSHPFYRTPRQKFSMALGFNLRTSESELLGSGFAFTPGVPPDGKVDLSIIRFSQDWTSRSLDSVLAARSLFSFGIDAFDSTVNEGDDPSGEFVVWLGQFQYAKFLGEKAGQLIFRTNLQYTNDPLFSMEQYAVGGALSVRGYRQNTLVRDRAYDLSLEYRYPLMKDASGRNVLALAPFVDAGGGNNNVLPNGPNPDFISSAGIGVRWDPTPKVHAELYWGYAFDDTITGDISSIQDDGIHFLLSANLLEWI